MLINYSFPKSSHFQEILFFVTFFSPWLGNLPSEGPGQREKGVVILPASCGISQGQGLGNIIWNMLPGAQSGFDSLKIAISVCEALVV